MKLSSLLALSFSILFLASCDDEPEDPIIPNEEEVITTLKLTLIDQATNDTLHFVFQDLSGVGTPPIFSSTDTLSPNKTYSGMLELLNEQETPADTITNEIEDEAEEHQFFYQTDVSSLSINYADTDMDGNPIGLASTFVTGPDTNQMGTLTITLRHEPNKFGQGVSGGDITNAGGETDIEVNFNIYVE